jgi:hypothetical protein
LLVILSTKFAVEQKIKIKLQKEMLPKNKLTLLLALMLCISTKASTFPFDFENKQYNELVHTVLIHPIDNQLLDPVIDLQEQEKLVLSFDLLGDIAPVFNYTIIHCSHNWKPSDIQPAQYISGFHEDEIRDYRFSINTLTPYIHYRLEFPTANLAPVLPGNYLLVVYDGQISEGTILVTRRFHVVDQKAVIAAQIARRPRNPAYANTKHQLDLEVGFEGVFNLNPNESIKLVIKQNSREDNAIYNLKPSHIYGNKLTYEYDEETVFDGGNQFRNFDIKSFRYQSERIQAIIMQNEHYEVKLWPDERRTFKSFVAETDLHGRKFTQAQKDQLTDIEGDYAWVEFFLNFPAPLTHGDVYIIGALTNFKIDDNSRMNYNYRLKGYEASLFLKQGYYNYLYAIVERGETEADVTAIEGNHWETQNEYTIMVYYRRPGTNFDQLVGYDVIVSHQ